MGRLRQLFAAVPRGRLLVASGAFALLAGVIAGVMVSATSGSQHPSSDGSVGVAGGNLTAPDSSNSSPDANPGRSAPAAAASAASTTTTPSHTGHEAAPATKVAVAAQPAGATTTTSTSVPRQGSGLSWRQQRVPAGTGSLQAVDCVNTSDCWAGGYSGIVATTDGGSRWAAQQFPVLGSGEFVAGIACTDAANCWALTSAGRVEHTTDGGAKWNPQTVAPLAQNASAYAITCADADHCWITGTANSNWIVARTTDGGQVWTANPVCSPNTCSDVWSISCPTTTTCLVVGVDSPAGSSSRAEDAVWASSDGGASWSRRYDFAGASNPPPALNGITCVDSSHCVIASTIGIASTSDGGSSWKADTPFAAGSVTCTFSGACWATGANDGSVLFQPSWRSGWTTQFRAPSGTLPAISCLNSGQCWAVEGAPGHAQAAGSAPGAVFARVN